jgi:hypothetical protein
MILTPAPARTQLPRQTFRRGSAGSGHPGTEAVVLWMVIAFVVVLIVALSPLLVVALVCDWFGWMEEP